MEKLEQYDTVVIGGGQAGLAVGYHLKRHGRSFVILDRNEGIGDSWRARWDSLKLYSPASRDGASRAWISPRPRTSYPTANEMADYLGAYAAGSTCRCEPGWASTASKGTAIATSRVPAVNVSKHATWWSPPASSRNRTSPTSRAELDPSITQLHSNAYRNLSQLQDGRVLVVGASHSGSDIAFEAASTHEVVLSGKDTGQLPASSRAGRGRFLFRGLFFVGTHVLTVDTPPGRKMRTHVRHGGAPLLRYRRKDLRAAGVERVLARTVGVENGLPVLDDGRVLDVRNVVWCTGFRPEYSWIRCPFETGADGYPVQYRGVVSSSPGLYMVGLPFLHSFASMLIGGAGRDAERVVQHIVTDRSAEPATPERRSLPVVAEERIAS